MAGNNYNPNSPTVVGEEWLADFYGTSDLVTEGPWAQRIRSRSAQTINKLSFLSYATYASFPSGSDMVLFEVIPAGAEIPSGTTGIDTYQPSADQQVGGWQTQSGGVVNLWQSLDEGVSTPDANFIAYISGVTQYRVRFASGGFSGTARALDVAFRLYICGSGDFSWSGDISLFHVASSTAYFLGHISTPSCLTYSFACGEINPKTLLPWTPADIQGFSSGTWALQVDSSSVTGTVGAVEMMVTRNTVENRVAAATWLANVLGFAPYQADTQQFESLPAGGASWAKPVSGDFTILLRRPRAPLVWKPTSATGTTPADPITAWASSKISGAEVPCSVPGVVSARPSLDGFGQVASIDFTTATRGRTIPLLVTTSAPAVSNDSLPYFFTGDLTHAPAVTVTQTVVQQFTSPAAVAFDYLRFLVKAGSAVANLLVKVKRVSDNVQFGNTITITPAQAAALSVEATGFGIFSTAGVNAALANGIRYYVEFSSADSTSAGSGWQVVMLGPHSSGYMPGGAATFGDTTDTALLAGVAQTHFDIPFSLAQTPATPSGLAVVKQRLVPASLPATQNCGIAAVEVVRVSWTATAIGALWARYEVQRSENNGASWRDIGWGIASEAGSIVFTDYEAPRGLSVQYRIRVVRTDGAASLYTDATAGLTCFPTGCEMLFVSNEAPSLGCAYNREPQMEYGFLAPSRDQIWEIYGADYAVAFMEDEDPGATFGARLTVNFGVQPTVDDVSIFAPLRAICRAATSYVCVLDWSGSRFFAHVQFGKGDWIEPGFSYHADVVVTEISGTPSVAVF